MIRDNSGWMEKLRAIRDKHAEETRNLTDEERIEYYRRKAQSLAPEKAQADAEAQ